jgi:hypothetical protein
VGDNFIINTVAISGASAAMRQGCIHVCALNRQCKWFLYYSCLEDPMVLFGSKVFFEKVEWGDDHFSHGLFLVSLDWVVGYGGQYFTNLGLQRENSRHGTVPKFDVGHVLYKC